MTCQPARNCQGWAAMRQILPLLGAIPFVALWLSVAAAETAPAPPDGAAKPAAPLKVAQARTIRTNAPGGLFTLLFGPLLPSHGAAPRADVAPKRGAGRAGTYRTLCVRMCDGYYWPMTFATPRSGFKRDRERCESSCAKPAKLYVHPNPGGDVETMRDLAGKAYSELPNAFRYRKEYDESCRCGPQPWSEAAREVYKAREIAARAAQTETAGVAAPAAKTAAKRPAVGRWRARNTPPSRKAGAGSAPRWWTGFE